MTNEAKRVLNFLAAMPSGNSTVTRKDCHEILMETGGSLLACGRLYNIVAKNIGAGVHRLHLELANP
jgi:hypothetical protein